MPSLIPNCPHWELEFDEKGNRRTHAPFEKFLTDASAQCDDVLVFSHGWNNTFTAARDLYARFFKTLGALPRRNPARRIGTVGVLWPSVLWPEDAKDGGGRAGGAASLGKGASTPAGDAKFILSMSSAFPGRQAQLKTLASLLQKRERSEASLQKFHKALMALDAPAGAKARKGAEDNGEAAMKKMKPTALFQGMDAKFPGPRAGGGAGLGDEFARLWNGARQATRMFTYWQMKKRAGEVGRLGLGPELIELYRRNPNVRVHLIGHSFGARLVSFSLLAWPANKPTSVHTLYLVQGAFSHFSFADRLPKNWGPSGGALKKMLDRLNGPACATFSKFDSAVGNAYPAAALLGRENSAAASDLMYQWGAIGHDGAQEVDAIEFKMQKAGTAYAFQPKRFHNFNSDGVIKTGTGPSGAHSDIDHEEVAWVLLLAAQLTS